LTKMGICLAPESPEQELLEREKKAARNISRGIDKALNEEKKQVQQINKLLLLGAGDSGKSTLFKQMRCIYGDGYNDKERKSFHSALCNNIVCCMKTLCKQSEEYGKVEEKNIPFKEQILALGTNHEKLREDGVGEAIKVLWEDKGIQQTYANASKFYLSDSAMYFFERIDVVMQASYIPTNDDVFRTRIPTTGIVEKEFLVSGHIFQMFDVGGQRSERKKWIHCFENVTSVLFVAALSAYDQVLYEDEQTNRMGESLELFGHISEMSWFHETPFILFLNKKDLFQEKIQKLPLKQYYEEFKGPDDYDSSAKFIENMFVAQDKGKRDIYPHCTCATDTENITAVFNAVKDIIIKRGLERAGLC